MSAQPQITIVLLNYRRPQNIPTILNSINTQTVKAKIFLWDNGVSNVNTPFQWRFDSVVDHYERSETNVGCMARWRMAKQATTRYVMSLDDDLCFNRNDALESMIRSLQAQDNPNRIVGFIGACFDRVPSYRIRRDYMCRYGDTNGRIREPVNTGSADNSEEPRRVEQSLIEKDQAVDVVKGRAMAFNRRLLDHIDLPSEREDDIYLSSVFANGARRFHRIPTLLNDAFHELPELGTGNWRQHGHLSSRDRALRAYFPPTRVLEID